jgi:hypothetical protein
MVWLNGSGGYAPGNQIGNATTRKPMSPSLIRDLMLKKSPHGLPHNQWVLNMQVRRDITGILGNKFAVLAIQLGYRSMFADMT